MLNASLDFLRLKEARAVDQFARAARLSALKSNLAEGETHLVENEIDAFLGPCCINQLWAEFPLPLDRLIPRAEFAVFQGL